MRFSYHSLRAALGRTDTKAGSHKTFNIIQSLLSHARLDNVTFKTTRECRSRKHISGNLFFVVENNKNLEVENKLVGKKCFGLTHFYSHSSPSEELYEEAYSRVQVGSNNVIIHYYSLSGMHDFELIGYYLKKGKECKLCFYTICTEKITAHLVVIRYRSSEFVFL